MQTINSISTKTVTTEQFLDYPFPESTFDEMYAEEGKLRQHWKPLFKALEALGTSGLQQRCKEVRRLLRDNGVTYNIDGDSHKIHRPWQLDLIPTLISHDEWGVIEKGLIQRAQLLRLVLADLYGPRKLFQDKVLPPELIYSHPGFLRRCDGIRVSSENNHLPLYAVDLTRREDGQMCVIEDRAQTPLGAGYTLENRLVLSRVLPGWFKDWQVRRLAFFFQTLRNTLMNMSWRKKDDIRIVLLSPGPDDETYFEHAFLANYLGYTLVQGADLTVREGRVWLKTLDGLQAVDVILRRIDDNFSDPLELRQDAYIGIAGLVQAVRMKQVAIANPLGSGILENQGLMAFMPALAHYFLNEDLQLPSTETWWCGQRQERDYVLANLPRLVIKRTAPSFGLPNTVFGELLSDTERKALSEQIQAQPYLFIAQEPQTRSTIPVFTLDNLEPRQMVLRNFLVADNQDYCVMPGGLTRVASRPDTHIISAQSEGISKDTWILADQPEKPLTLLSPVGEIATLATGHGELPSRVAENLFWLGRYLERAESVIRILRTVLLYQIEPITFSEAETQNCLYSLLRAVTHATKTYPGFVGEDAEERLAAPSTELLSILLDKSRVGSLAFILQSLLYAASSVRDRTSPDMKRVFSKLNDSLQFLQNQREKALVKKGSSKSLNHDNLFPVILEQLSNMLTHFAAFIGFAMESMTHSQGWRFVMIGRRLERAQQMIPLQRSLLSKVSENESLLLEQLLANCDSLMTYRRRYRTQVQLQPTLELLLLDESNPRALGYQFERLQNYLHNLPGCGSTFSQKRPEERLVLEGLTRLRLVNMEELLQSDSNHFRTHLDQLLVRLNHILPNLSDAITNSYFSHVEQSQQLVRFSKGNNL
jgi:uncharacterized circularly permuted ATP-grasp superfamily protein/uncharacterized alpha-E superfamily protein